MASKPRKEAAQPGTTVTDAQVEKTRRSSGKASKKQYVEVRVAGCELRGRKVCPFAVLLRPGSSKNVWAEVARTEVVYYDANPGFVTPFEVENDDTTYRVALYSKTRNSDDIHRCSYLGYAEFTVERMLRKDDGVIERVLRTRRGKPEAKRGHLILCGELVDVPEKTHTFSIRFGFGAESGVWGPENRRPMKTFYVVYRAIVNGISDADWVPVYRSEIRDAHAARNTEVMFDGASLISTQLYASDENRGLRFEVFHYNTNGPHQPLGFVQTSASAFRYAKPGGKLFMIAVPGSRLQKGTVFLDMAKTGLHTRRGGVSSVFVLRASNFVWGETQVEVDQDDYLERDHDGRKRVEWLDGVQPKLPTGVSYISNRRGGAGGDSGAESASDYEE